MVDGRDWFPRDVEEALQTHPGVAQAALVGVSEPPRPRAYVEPRPGELPSVVELKAHAAARLDFPLDLLEIELVDALPLTPTGKIAKTDLRARAEGGA